MSGPDPSAADARLRRLRAALGASADALMARPGLDGAALLSEEVALLASIAPAASVEVWRDLRTRALALAAEMEPTEEALRVLEERLRADEARLRS